MNDSPADVRAQLSEFSAKLNVPAVIGGVLSRDGTLDYDVVGFRCRGSDDAAEIHDKWHIGSCAKSITAVLYARLVERGDTDWDCPVASLFPDLTHQIDEGWGNRTIEEVFLCRAGMKANPSIRAMLAGWSDTRSLVDQRTEAALIAMQKVPGVRGRFVYSNLSYMVIGAAIDRITGVPYEEALARHVLEPLGITSLGYGPPPKVWGRRARFQLAGIALFIGKPADPQSARSDNPRMLSSAGTMHITIADWSKFLSLFINGGGDLLQPGTIDFLLKYPEGSGVKMAKGWVKAEGIEGVSFGMQGSNTMWSAAALLNEKRTRLSLVVSNDGRTRIVSQTALLAAKLLNPQ